MGKQPWEKKRAIFQILDSKEITDQRGYFLRKVDWLNPNQIHEQLKSIGMGNISRDEITKFLNDCCENEKRYVERRKPQRNDPDSETKAQNEYKITNSGKGLLNDMNQPIIDFINKRIKD